MGKYFESFLTSNTVSLIPRPPLRVRGGNSGRGGPERSPEAPVPPRGSVPRPFHSGVRTCIPGPIRPVKEHFRESSIGAPAPLPGWGRTSTIPPYKDGPAVQTGGGHPPPPPPVRRTSPRPGPPSRPQRPNRG